MNVKMHSAMRAQYHEVEDYLRLGWIALEPNGGIYQHIYGIFVFTICDCHIPHLRETRKLDR